MSIDGISGTGSTQSTDSSGQLKASKDEFLKLFMAQLQHQDPFAPTSGADMVAQLAQLSTVEQAKQTNTALADLAASQASAASAGLSSLIGRDCNANVGMFAVDGKQGGLPPAIDLASATPTKGASLVIKDSSGKEIRKIAIPDGTTAGSVVWDGLDASGKPIAAGSYQMSIDQGTSTANSTLTAQWHSRVDAVELTNDGPRLRMGSILLAPGDIRTIGSSTTTKGVQ